MPTNSSTSLNVTRRILLVEPEGEFENSLFAKLSAQNLRPANALTSTRGLLAAIEQTEPEVLIFSLDALDDEVLQSLMLVKENTPLPVLVFAQKHSKEMVRLVVNAGVNAYIVDDVEPSRIPVIIDLAEARFVQEREVYLELTKTKAKLVERKVIEKAKGIIMLQKKISEDQAYAQLRRSAMNQGRPIADLAKSVVSVFDQRI